MAESKILQGASGLLTGKIIDNSTGLGIAGTSLATLKFTLYDRDTGTLINANNDVALVPGTAVDANGNLSHTLAPADNPIVTAGKDYEIHVARFTWTYGSPVKTGKEEINFTVRALITPT